MSYNQFFFSDLSELIVWNEVKEFKYLYHFSFKPVKEYRHQTEIYQYYLFLKQKNTRLSHLVFGELYYPVQI